METSSSGGGFYEKLSVGRGHFIFKFLIRNLKGQYGIFWARKASFDVYKTRNWMRVEIESGKGDESESAKIVLTQVKGTYFYAFL